MGVSPTLSEFSASPKAALLAVGGTPSGLVDEESSALPVGLGEEEYVSSIDSERGPDGFNG